MLFDIKDIVKLSVRAKIHEVVFFNIKGIVRFPFFLL